MKSFYIHGTSPVEQQRLSLLNNLMNACCLNAVNVQPREKVLDVGSGLGQFSREMAQKTAQAVVAVEIDDRQLTTAKALASEAGKSDRIDFRKGSALSLPLSEQEWGTFDLVHSRFCLEHLVDPLRAVKQMVKAVKPGGRIVLIDDDHETFRCYPEPSGFETLWNSHCRSYDRVGNDPYIGRRLLQLLYQAGAKPSRNTEIFFGSNAGEKSFQDFVTNLLEILKGAEDTLLRLSLIDQEQFRKTIDNIQLWRRREDVAIWYTMCYAEAVLL